LSTWILGGLLDPFQVEKPQNVKSGFAALSDGVSSNMQADRHEELRTRVYPIWTRLDYKKTLKLEGFQVLCAPVIFALTLLDIEQLGLPAASGGTPGSVGQHAGVVQVGFTDLHLASSRA
jgi:hypothetical protein